MEYAAAHHISRYIGPVVWPRSHSKQSRRCMNATVWDPLPPATVLENIDLVAMILKRVEVDPLQFVRFGLVSKTWRSACRVDETLVLRAVARCCSHTVQIDAEDFAAAAGGGAPLQANAELYWYQFESRMGCITQCEWPVDSLLTGALKATMTKESSASHAQLLHSLSSP